MRSRVTILCGVILLSIVAPRPAAASGWGAFVAWLSELDPNSKGLGVEIPIWPACSPANRSDRCSKAPDKHTPMIRASTAILVGSVDDQVGKMYVMPTLGIVEWQLHRYFFVAGGAGAIRVGGIPAGDLTRALLQARATIGLGQGFGFRVEGNLIPTGFPANAFGPGKPATGTEGVLGLSFVWMH